MNKFKILILFSLFACLCTFSYAQSSVEVIKIDTLPAPQAKPALQAQPKLRIGAQIGYAYRFGRIPNNIHPSIKSHLTQLRNNLGYGADISYYIKNIGIGARYSGISASSLTNNFPYWFEDETTGQIIEIETLFSEKIGIHYLGVLISARHFFASSKQPNKQCFYANVGFGYTMYRNNFIMLAQAAKMIGGAGTFHAEMGYDYLINNHFAIGLQAYVVFATMKNYSIIYNGVIVENGQLAQRENLSHIGISLGLRFCK